MAGSGFPLAFPPEENMKATRRALSFVVLFVTLTILSRTANAQKPPVFQLVPTPNEYDLNNTLYASSASSPNDIWAVGNTTIHFDGKQWTEFPAPGATDNASEALRGVLTFSPTLAFAGGGGDDAGQIIDRWNGQQWERVQGLPFPPIWEPSVMTMSGTSPNDIWVTGSVSPNQNYNLFFEHWNGTSWSTDNFLFGGVGWFYGASQDATNDAWVVGDQWVGSCQVPLAVHYDGSTWVVASLPPSDGCGELLGILALAPNNVWTVGWQNSGGDAYTNVALMYHFDGNSWTRVPSLERTVTGNTLAGIVANSPDDMYAFGYSADPSGYGFDSLLLHGDGTEWTVVPSPNPRHYSNYIDNELLTGVIPSPGNVWILGQQYGSNHTVCTGSCTLAIQTSGGNN
jgi:hypothetical protein